MDDTFIVHIDNHATEYMDRQVATETWLECVKANKGLSHIWLETRKGEASE